MTNSMCIQEPLRDPRRRFGSRGRVQQPVSSINVEVTVSAEDKPKMMKALKDLKALMAEQNVECEVRLG